MRNIDYSILGSLTVRLGRDAAPTALGEKLQLLLARMLLEQGLTLPLSVLLDDVWGDAHELANERNTVQVAIGQLRKRLGDTPGTPELIVSVGTGYRLVVDDPLQIDAERFRLLAGRGRALAREHPRAARAMLAEAVQCWRGPVLGELGEAPWAAGHVAELVAARALARADLNEVRLALGEHAEVEATLRRQIVEHPTDERRRAQLVRALDGAGRAAEAGLAYRDAARDLGALGPELRRLGERIARGQPAEQTPIPATALHAGRPASALLCASLTSPARWAGQAGLGTLALLIDRGGGTPYPLDDHELLGSFDDAAAALRAGEAIVAYGGPPPSVAVHVGATVQVGDRLAGPGAARCRLLARAAHPGQLLVSGDAAAALPKDVALRDLGEQRLEDLLAGDSVYERAGAGSPFPAPDTLSGRPHNLPVQQTRFVGRERELAELSRAVGAGELITLFGVGGCGKTRLALQLAASRLSAFNDGAWFVELAELDSEIGAAALAAAIADQLGVRALPGESAPVALARHLSDRSLLLILDNCEHVLAPCVALIPQLRPAAPRVCLLVTSRRRLRIDGERVVDVPPMDTEAGGGDVLSDAVELLLDRADSGTAAVDGGDPLADATRVCRAFEGSPLAIELAAAHVSTRGLASVAAEVEAMLRGELGLDYFASDDPRRPPRQRTIEAAIRWSHALLDEPQRRVLDRLAVFRGSFGLAEAQIVAGEDALGRLEVAGLVRQLVDRSVVAVDAPLDAMPRMHLSQPIRAFLLAQLQPAELERIRVLHVRTFCTLATRTAPHLFGDGERAALDRLEADHDNLRVALGWLVDNGRAREALAMVGALWWFWFSHGHFEEGSGWVRQVLAMDTRPSRRRVRALRAASHLAWWRGDYAATSEYNRELAQCAQEIDDAWGLAWAPMGDGAVQMFLEPELALLRFEDSRLRFEALGRDWEAGYALQLVGAAHWFAGDESEAGVAYEEASSIFAGIGHGSVLASVRRGAGLMAARCGQPERGAALCSDALRISTQIGDRAGSAQALNFLASISRDEGDVATALDRFADALAHARETGELWATCSALDGIAVIAGESDEAELAARLLACSKNLADRAGYRQSAREQRQRALEVSRLERELGERDYDRAVAVGQMLSVGDAVAAALAFAARRA